MHPCGVGAIELSDGELGSQAVNGDVTALAALLERHRPVLYATAVGLLGNRQSARRTKSR